MKIGYGPILRLDLSAIDINVWKWQYLVMDKTWVFPVQANMEGPILGSQMSRDSDVFFPNASSELHGAFKSRSNMTNEVQVLSTLQQENATRKSNKDKQG